MSVAHVEGAGSRLGDRRWAAAWAVTALTLAGGIAVALAVALANQPYFDLLNGVVGARDSVARGLLFSSWLVLVSAPFVVWRPSLIHPQSWHGLRLARDPDAKRLSGDAVARRRERRRGCDLIARSQT